MWMRDFFILRCRDDVVLEPHKRFGVPIPKSIVGKEHELRKWQFGKCKIDSDDTLAAKLVEIKSY
jgi:hypothetical protein